MNMKTFNALRKIADSSSTNSQEPLNFRDRVKQFINSNKGDALFRYGGTAASISVPAAILAGISAKKDKLKNAVLAAIFSGAAATGGLALQDYLKRKQNRA